MKLLVDEHVSNFMCLVSSQQKDYELPQLFCPIMLQNLWDVHGIMTCLTVTGVKRKLNA